MSSLFGSKSAGQSSLDELAAVTKEFPDLATADPPAPADAPEPPAAAPEKAAEGAPPTPAPEATAEPDPAQAAPEAAPEAAEAGADGKPRMVPAAAVASERTKARDAEARARAAEDREAALQQQFAELRGRLEQVTQMVRPQPPPPQQQQPEDPAPDPNEDPMAFMAWQGRENQRLRSALGQVAGHVQQQTAQQQVQQSYVADAQRFAAATPDFGDAYRHLLSQRVAQLQASGWADQAAIARQIAQDEATIVVGALRAGKSPAEAVYGMAKASGWTPKPPAPAPAAPATPATEQPRNPDGTFAKPAPSVDPALAEAKARAAAGHREGGAAPAAELSLEDVVKRTGGDFDKAYAQWEGKTVRKNSLFRT